MSGSEYEDFVFAAGLLDQPDPVAAWKKISQAQPRLVDFLAGKTDYRVQAANGTNVRMSVAGKTWLNCDGHENFPDGEVFTGPVLDSVEGRIHFSFPAVHHGREVQDVVLQFRQGKVVDARASKGQDFLFSMLDMDGGSRFLFHFDGGNVLDGFAGLGVANDDLLVLRVGIPPAPGNADANRPTALRTGNEGANISQFARPTRPDSILNAGH